MKTLQWTTLALLMTLCLEATRAPAQSETEPAVPATNTVAGTVSETNAGAGAEQEAAVSRESSRRKGVRREVSIKVGKDLVFGADDSAEAALVIGGSAKMYGEVRDAVLVFGGDIEMNEGSAAREVIAIGGDVEIKGGAVARDVVAILGSVTVRSNATVQGVTAVGGVANIAAGVSPREVNEIDFSALGLPSVKWLQRWLIHCALKLRLLAPQVGWVWAVAGGFLLLYVLLAIGFSRPIEASVKELTARPATTFLVGLLVKMLFPIVITLLGITGIGLLVIPFILVAILVGVMFGKVAILQYLGSSVARLAGASLREKPLIALLVGAVLVSLLYMVPVLSLVIFGVITIWGLGAATLAALAGTRRERPQTPPVAAGPGACGTGLLAAAPAGRAGEGLRPAPEPPVAGPFAMSPGGEAALPAALAFPLAGFWERIGAAFLDLTLLGVVAGWFGPAIFLAALAYFAGMWAWKGTTIGGIVLKLKIVRYDSSPITFSVALVRGLAAAFSVVALFLGFFWIAWDSQKQGWHDKIAGTVVVRTPYSTPLVCL